MKNNILFSIISAVAAVFLIRHTVIYQDNFPQYRNGLFLMSFADRTHSLEIRVYLLPLAVNIVLAAAAVFVLPADLQNPYRPAGTFCAAARFSV